MSIDSEAKTNDKGGISNLKQEEINFMQYENTNFMSSSSSTRSHHRLDYDWKNVHNEFVNIMKFRYKFVNSRYLGQEEKTYGLERFEKNKMLIFNQINFPEGPRKGTEKDVACLKKCFEQLGFEIDTYDDCRRCQIDEIMIKATLETDLSDYGCFAVVVLTHGSDYGQLRSYDLEYNETILINYLNVPSLITKPKILIIQACRGSEVSQPILIDFTNIPSYHPGDNTKPSIYTVTDVPDMLILYSTFSGTKAHRNTKEGSWFIQCFCKHIEDAEADDDIHFILSRLFRDISINYSNYESQCPGKQIPVFVSTLTRKLHFNLSKDTDHKAGRRNESNYNNDEILRSRRKNSKKEEGYGSSDKIQKNDLTKKNIEENKTLFLFFLLLLMILICFIVSNA